ncbi:DUF427 domain-containing protein [Microbacterium pygmaeum]|uniref:Uncharacterized conserved protein, DUF427 family n=1 Tax=Microbacterium pygmaeum TaxID=370764 RepID=A0A1G8BBF4_9MICO|nr:DUF427 domain-containing protein [Microbacterium pygmaeum]SDH30549.1 Uncharacterized conserved protein, DUF427 family [Microbacterium pygmaeum]
MSRPQPDPVAPGQESVWDYPRPPRIERVDRTVAIDLGGVRIVETGDVVRVLETSHPPVYYLRISDFRAGSLTAASGSSFCEFKGSARYLDVHGGDQTAPGAAWNYPNPSHGYGLLADRVAVYAARMQQCSVDGEIVAPQPGGFYGGWVTADLAGPFKGVPGSMGW